MERVPGKIFELTGSLEVSRMCSNMTKTGKDWTRTVSGYCLGIRLESDQELKKSQIPLTIHSAEIRTFTTEYNSCALLLRCVIGSLLLRCVIGS